MLSENSMVSLVKNMVRVSPRRDVFPKGGLVAAPSLTPSPKQAEKMMETIERVAPTAQLSNKGPRDLSSIPLTEEEKRELLRREFKKRRSPRSTATKSKRKGR